MFYMPSGIGEQTIYVKWSQHRPKRFFNLAKGGGGVFIYKKVNKDVCMAVVLGPWGPCHVTWKHYAVRAGKEHGKLFLRPECVKKSGRKPWTRMLSQSYSVFREACFPTGFLRVGQSFFFLSQK